MRTEETLNALEYEPGNVPPTFVSGGKIYQSTKSNLKERLTSFDKQNPNNVPKQFDSHLSQLVIDLSMITVILVRQASTKSLTTLKSFFDKVWDHIIILSRSYIRVDIVGDNYEDNHPLKDQTRTTRGSGTSTNLHLDGPLPTSFTNDFLLNTSNKALLYKKMTDYFAKRSLEQTSPTFVIVQGRNVIRGNIGSSSHAEADYRIICQILDGITCG